MEVHAGRKATLVLVSNAAGAALGYASLLVIGRYVDPGAYGAFLFALGATGILAVVSNLGLGAVHQRSIAQGTDPSAALGVLVRLRLALGAALLGLLGLAYLLWTAVLGRELTDATTPAVLLLALLFQVLAAARQVLLDTWQGQQRVHRVEGVRLADSLLLLLLLANAGLLLAHLAGRWTPLPAVGAFWAGGLGLEGPPSLATAALLVAGCYAAAKGVSLALGWAWSLRDRLRLGAWDRALARQYLRLAFPFALVGALVLILQATDTVMLGFFWTSHEVGLYGVAQKLSALGLLLAGAVSTVLFPRFAQLSAAGDAAKEASTYAHAERYLLLLAAPLAAGLAALPAQGIHIAVGDAYLGAAEPLRVLALWSLAVALLQPLESRFLARGDTRLVLHASALNVVANVVLNAVLIPRSGAGLGPTGAAIATVASTLAAYLYARAQAHRQYGVPWLGSHQPRILGAALAAGAFWWSAPLWAGPAWFDRVWELAAWGAAGAVVYAAVLIVLGELRARDLRFLRRVAHPSQLLAELRGR